MVREELEIRARMKTERLSFILPVK
jgi:hypothetical protein